MRTSFCLVGLVFLAVACAGDDDDGDSTTGGTGAVAGTGGIAAPRP